MACPIHRSNLGSLKQLQPCDLCKVCSFPLHLVPVFTGSDSRILLSFNPSPGIPAWSCSSLLLGRRLGQIVGVHMEKRGKLLSSVVCRSFQGFISLSGAWGMQGWTRSCSSCCRNMWEPIPILFFFFFHGKSQKYESAREILNVKKNSWSVVVGEASLSRKNLSFEWFGVKINTISSQLSDVHGVRAWICKGIICGYLKRAR